MRLFQLLQSNLIESDGIEDPFADPTPVDLNEYLAKLEAQRERYSTYWKVNWIDLRKLRRDNELGSITGEAVTIEGCNGLDDLTPGWTKIGEWQFSPGVMADPRLRHIVEKIRSDEVVMAAVRDIWKKIARVQRQNKLAKKVQKGS